MACFKSRSHCLVLSNNAERVAYSGWVRVTKRTGSYLVCVGLTLVNSQVSGQTPHRPKKKTPAPKNEGGSMVRASGTPFIGSISGGPFSDDGHLVVIVYDFQPISAAISAIVGGFFGADLGRVGCGGAISGFAALTT